MGAGLALAASYGADVGGWTQADTTLNARVNESSASVSGGSEAPPSLPKSNWKFEG